MRSRGNGCLTTLTPLSRCTDDVQFYVCEQETSPLLFSDFYFLYRHRIIITVPSSGRL